MRFTRILRMGIALAVPLTAAAALPAGAATGSATTTTTVPPKLGCRPGQAWFDAGNVYQRGTPYGTGAWHSGFNATAPAMDIALATSTTSTVQYSISASEQVDAGVIFASVQLTATEGFSYSHADSSSFTVTVPNVPRGKYGIIQGGNMYMVATGTYSWMTPECHLVSDTKVLAQFPADLPAVPIGGLSSTDAPPWAQTP